MSQFETRVSEAEKAAKFYFSITRPALDPNTNKPTVYMTFKPLSAMDPKERSMLQPTSDVAHFLNSWMTLITAYNSISLDVNDRFLEEYETKFFTDDKILDDAADTRPFDDQHQRLLEYTLKAIEDAIEMIYVPAECKQEILKDARALKNRTPSLTKNQVVRGVARIFAKIKLKGYDFATAFNEELPKTIGKIFAEKGVNYVLEQLPKLLHHFLP